MGALICHDPVHSGFVHPKNECEYPLSPAAILQQRVYELAGGTKVV